MKYTIGNMTMEDLSAVRRMTRPDAEAFLKRFELTPDEHETVLNLAGHSLESQQPVHPANAGYDPYRRIWFAVGHLLGASFEKLAYPYGISRQTVIASVNKILPTKVRAAQRISRTIGLEDLSAYKRKFYENKELLASMTLIDAAAWLHEHTELDHD